MEMSWSKNYMSVEMEDAPQVIEKLNAGGMYQDEHFRIYIPSWNSIVSGKQHHTNLGKREFLFMGDGGNAIMAKLIL